MKSRIYTLALLFVVVSAHGVFANDDSADLTATAQVGAAVEVLQQEDLNFGVIVPGTNGIITVSNGDTGGSGTDGTTTVGEFLVSGQANASVLLNFDLPNELLNGGSATLPIFFDAADYGWHAGADESNANFTPADFGAGNDLSLTFDGTTPEITILLGGRVEPSNTQETGTYSATVTLTATQDL